MQQRVAIARAIVNQPKVLLLDESLSALDKRLRKDMQFELREIQKKLGITFIFVTHDQEEALAMSDEIFVLNEGKIQQSGSPVDIYDEVRIDTVSDYLTFLPDTLPNQFTSKDFGKAAKITQQRAGTLLNVLLETGVVEKIGKEGRSYLYQRNKL